MASWHYALMNMKTFVYNSSKRRNALMRWYHWCSIHESHIINTLMIWLGKFSNYKYTSCSKEQAILHHKIVQKCLWLTKLLNIFHLFRELESGTKFLTYRNHIKTRSFVNVIRRCLFIFRLFTFDLNLKKNEKLLH